MRVFADKKTKFLILLVAVNLVFSTSFSDKSDNELTDPEKAKIVITSLVEKSSHVYITERIIESAFEYIGVPHIMGGTSEKGMDCSGLLVTVFGENGIYLPHSCRALSAFGKVISEKNNLLKGDLLFFTNTYKSDSYITHTGLYIGDNKFIHTSSKKGVTITRLDDPWWQGKFAFGARIFHEQS